MRGAWVWSLVGELGKILRAGHGVGRKIKIIKLIIINHKLISVSLKHLACFAYLCGTVILGI